MIFVREVLAPGPGTRSKATFRWRPFQSVLSGSLFFIPPPLVEVMILHLIHLAILAIRLPTGPSFFFTSRKVFSPRIILAMAFHQRSLEAIFRW